MKIQIEISPGELLDKITILQIKSEQITDPAKLANVLADLEMLDQVRKAQIPATPQVTTLTEELRAINNALWQVEDDLRDHERRGNFDATFIELARSVYHHNDQRAEIKRRINELLGSPLAEAKSYAPY